MKKILISALIVTCIFVFCLSFYADDGLKIIDPQIAEIIKSQLTSEDKEKLSNLDETLSKEVGETLLNEVVIKIYYGTPWEISSESASKMIEEREKIQQTYNSMEYFVLTEKPYKVKWFNGKVSKSKTADIPTYITDIVSMSDNVAVNGKQIPVTGVFCLDNYGSHMGIIVCILTQNEAVFKYYSNYQSEAVVYSESAFRLYATEYYEYLTSYEHNYDENGSPLGGSFLSFNEYVDKNHSGFADLGVAISAQPQNKQSTITALHICMIVLCVAALVAILTVLKKKKQQF